MENAENAGVTGTPMNPSAMRTPLRERQNDAPPLTPMSVGSKTPSTGRTPSTGSSRKPPRTPMNQIDIPCAVCLSPLNTARSDDPNGPVRESFITPCNHSFHLCCLQGCRTHEHGHCPLCRAALPAGLTPPLVREQRNNAAAQDATQAQLRELMVNRAAAAREAVRTRMRAMQQRAREELERTPEGSRPTQRQRVSPNQMTIDDANNAALFPSPFRSALEVVGQHAVVSELEGVENELEGAESAEVRMGDGELEESARCHHCRGAGAMLGECEGCSETFCGLCAMIDYERPQERLFCLDCVFDQRDQRRAAAQAYREQQGATMVAA